MTVHARCRFVGEELLGHRFFHGSDEFAGFVREIKLLVVFRIGGEVIGDGSQNRFGVQIKIADADGLGNGNDFVGLLSDN